MTNMTTFERVSWMQTGKGLRTLGNPKTLRHRFAIYCEDIAAGADDLRFTHIAELLDFGEQFRSCEHCLEM